MKPVFRRLDWGAVLVTSVRKIAGAAVLGAIGLLLSLSGCGESPFSADGGRRGERFHPDGFAAPAVHGAALKAQELDCRRCHGARLQGGRGGGCDRCHAEGWRTSCTYCHGGTLDSTGAPPRDLAGHTTRAETRFYAHAFHVNETNHGAYDCTECHKKPEDVLSEGHVFDSTPGIAEVDMRGGLSRIGTYELGGCQNLYCHGDGRHHNGHVRPDDGPLGCTGCHPGPGSEPYRFWMLSGQHARHLQAGLACVDCHAATVTATSDSILTPALHVNGRADVAFGTASMTFASGACTGSCHGDQHAARVWATGDENPHPLGWDSPEQHGRAVKLGGEDCRSCHGADLAGGVGRSCDSCHAAGWRTSCTYCHGGTSDSTGAPPRDLSGETARGNLRFPGHGAHVSGASGRHVPWDCDQCHSKPTDVLSPGHLFDSTPGRAEVMFSAGLSPSATYADGTCASTYCHGNGRGPNGTVATTAAPMTCSSCHASQASAPADWSAMSGRHEAHLRAGVACAECHGTVVDAAGDRIVGPALHVNGRADLSFASGVDYAGGACTGACHGESHAARPWSGAWNPHPLGWAEPSQHGSALEQQAQDCRACHGADLRGGIAQKSCDDCHRSGWRTSCTYCHGGRSNDTGAPPRDLSGERDGIHTSFPPHDVHVVATDKHGAFDCAQCHAKPSDVLSPGHVFDETPGRAEVAFGGGLSSAGGYAAGICTNNYCHGNGQGPNGRVARDAAPMTCSSCHASAASPSTAWASMSGRHLEHLRAGIACAECHGTVVDSRGATIIEPGSHVDGKVELGFGAASITAAAGACTGSCHGEAHSARPWRGSWDPHPLGFGAASRHGSAFKKQSEDCRACHGADLRGGRSGKSCDECHQVGWRTSCTYCHGGTKDQTGAPPRDLSGETSSARTTFPPHSVHVEPTSKHVAYDCDQCHRKPTDVLSPGHVFDDTPGVAEVVFSGGQSAAGTYAAGTCTNNYCHGNGQGPNGSVARTDGPMGCASCHPSSASAPTAWSTMSGRHYQHLVVGLACAECHGTVVDPSGAAIVDPGKHIDGRVELGFGATNMSYATDSCTGTCHAEQHAARPWRGPWSPHPVGWREPGQHGIAFNLQAQDCRPCHGATLTGGKSGRSCDECHASGWRSQCTYCHGGTANASGAPPRDLTGETNVASLTFPGHTAHVTARATHAAYDCVQCHDKPTDVLSPGHAIDSTPGRAEVSFTGGLSSSATYASGTCGSTYCHGNGQGPNGIVTTSSPPMTCTSCHAAQGSPPSAWATMSGLHGAHLTKGIVCAECHSATVDAAGATIVDPSRHVNGRPDLAFGATNVVYAAGQCNGTCHGDHHVQRPWVGSADPHPTGWADPASHGLAAKLGQQDCRQCHGADLAGGTGRSCDDCHRAGWRTSCTYCHGGTSDTTGAPPRDLNGTTATSQLSFPPHAVHVGARAMHVAWDCNQCHSKPTDVLTANHMFDGTPARSEVVMTGGLSAASTYSAGTCSSNYCHGNGRGPNGSVAKTAAPMSCNSCHPGPSSLPDTWASMSGEHQTHLEKGYVCADCHGATVNAAGAIIDASKHVDGLRELRFSVPAFTWSAGACTGNCHGEIHSNRSW